MTTTISPVASVYGANAAPIASSAAALGVTNQPATTGGNAAVNTGFVSTPVPITGGGAGTVAAAASNFNTTPAAISAAQSLAANGQAAGETFVNSQGQAQPLNLPANAGVGSRLASDLVTASGGGVISDALKSGVSSIVAFAQKGMADIQKAIQGDMAANNGEVDPAKMQLYTMKMSTYELLNQMAAKIQEKEERSIQVWLQR